MVGEVPIHDIAHTITGPQHMSAVLKLTPLTITSSVYISNAGCIIYNNVITLNENIAMQYND